MLEVTDSDYILRVDLKPLGQYTFQGFGGLTRIVLNKTLNLWQRVSYNSQTDSGLQVGLFNGSTGFLIGIQSWYLTK